MELRYRSLTPNPPKLAVMALARDVRELGRDRQGGFRVSGLVVGHRSSTGRGVERLMDGPEASGNTRRFHPASVEETFDWLADEYGVGVPVAGTAVRKGLAGRAIALVHD